MKILKFAFFPLVKVIGALTKTPKPGEPARPVDRDDAQREADKRRELAGRRGGAADILTGGLGSEAGSGASATLGS